MTEKERLDKRSAIEEKIGYESYRGIIVKMLRNGMTVPEISNQIFASRGSISSIARKEGISLRENPEFAYIYSLTCPITDKIRYIGKSNNPVKRVNGHMKKPTNEAVKQWLDWLKEEGKRPIVNVIAKVKYKHWPKAERALINKYAKLTCLMNIDR